MFHRCALQLTSLRPVRTDGYVGAFVGVGVWLLPKVLYGEERVGEVARREDTEGERARARAAKSHTISRCAVHQNCSYTHHTTPHHTLVLVALFRYRSCQRWLASATTARMKVQNRKPVDFEKLGFEYSQTQSHVESVDLSTPTPRRLAPCSFEMAPALPNIA